MTPIKKILFQMQENEKKYRIVCEPESLKTAEPLMKDYVQYLKNKSDEAISAFAEANLNLNLCKTFLSKLIESHLTPVELKRSIKDFLETLNQK